MREADLGVINDDEHVHQGHGLISNRNSRLTWRTPEDPGWGVRLQAHHRQLRVGPRAGIPA
jgi:hypothetical protein